MRLARSALIGILVALPTASARAESGMRCGQWLVSRGASEREVYARCGAPTEARSERVVDQTDDGLTVGYTVWDSWRYDRGPTEFVRTALFRNGILVDVDVGGYGH